MARLPRINSKTTQQSVLETLRSAVLGNELPGGTHLVVADLVAQLGVSSTPVREALRQLATEDLIRFEPYKGAVVHTPTLEEVQEVYEARLLLEPAVARKMVERITEDELETARHAQKEMEATKDIGQWVLLNRRFHGGLVAAARSPRLAKLIGTLEDAAEPQVALSIRADPSRVSDSNVEHKQLLKAVQARDVERAVEVLVQHLRSTVRAIESLALAAPSDDKREEGASDV